MKKRICFLMCLLLSISAFAGCGETETIVENKEITLSLPYGERKGIYTGEVTDGIPNGQGRFETENDNGEKWIYEGGFSEGIFEGEGKTIWEDGGVQIGEYKDGVWQLSEWGLLAGFQENGLASVTAEAMNFMKENQNIFPAKELEELRDFLDDSITYKMIIKEPSKYGATVLKMENMLVNQIFTGNINADQDYKYTYLILTDSEMNVYEVFMTGELPDVYEGDTISTLYGVVTGNHSFDSTLGVPINAAVIAPCLIQK